MKFTGKKDKEKNALKVLFSLYPLSNQILLQYVQNVDSQLSGKYIAKRVFLNKNVHLRLNEIEELPKDPKVEEIKKAEVKKAETKEEKAEEAKQKQLLEIQEKQEKAAIKFMAILYKETDELVIKNVQNCTLAYWVNYISWRVEDQINTKEIAKTTAVTLIDIIVKQQRKNQIEMPGVKRG